ncbi:unnamed protein product [Psylliodes chrysocephalus]|uniref:C2H2-type domain-containing protein n=1 Tax=Psylliodes chrysocephalus TaxID=3402493 RepID=A0A9P0CWH3_9CUCU|nr:unnamed protein product [Psylliodes chrysocephala]
MSKKETATLLLPQPQAIKVEPIFNNAGEDAFMENLITCDYTTSMDIKQEIGDESVAIDNVPNNKFELIVIEKGDSYHQDGEADMDINSTTAGNLIKNYNKCSIEIKQEICDDVDVIPNSETEPIVIEKCEFCHEEFFSPKLKEDHIDVHLSENITCPVCNKSFKTKGDYLNHYPIHQSQISPSNDSFECSTCLKTFVNKQNLTFHVKIHQLTAFQCQECFKCYTRKDDLIIHMRVHSGERPFKCKECLKTFTQRGNLRSHTLTHLGQKEQCPFCLKLFSKQSLKKHEKRHKEKPKFSCDSCPRSFYVLSHLKRHMISHTGEKMYQCEQCYKKFTEPQHLKRHLLVHSGVKAFQCDFCFKKFTEKSHLKSHMKNNHSSDKPHACPVCFKGFRKKSDVTNHVQNQHVQEKIFKCLLCGQGFCKEFFLRMHLKSKHGDIKTDNVEVKGEFSEVAKKST